MSQQKPLLGSVPDAEIKGQVDRMGEEEFVMQYTSLPQPEQHRIYPLLSENQQKMIWRAYEARKTNPWAGLGKEQLKVKYLALENKEREQVYLTQLSENQKKLIWDIFKEEEERKKDQVPSESKADFDVGNEQGDGAIVNNTVNIRVKSKQGDRQFTPISGEEFLLLEESERKEKIANLTIDQLFETYKNFKTQEERDALMSIVKPQQKSFILKSQRNEQSNPKTGDIHDDDDDPLLMRGGRPGMALGAPSPGASPVRQVPVAPNPLLMNRRPAGSQAANNENEGYIMCQACCGNCMLYTCFPCCLVCGCNKVVVRQGEAGLMMRNGKFHKSLPPGIYLINSCLYTVNVMSIKSRVVRQNNSQLITADNMSIMLDFYVSYELSDPYYAAMGLHQVDAAIITIAAGKLKSLVSALKFQQILVTSHDLNSNLRNAIEVELAQLGITINSAEVTAIILSKELTMSMAQVAISERDRLAQVRLAEANFESSKITNEAAAILKENNSSMDLHFFETLKHIAQKWNQTIITADGMLYVPKK